MILYPGSVIWHDDDTALWLAGNTSSNPPEGARGYRLEAFAVAVPVEFHDGEWVEVRVRALPHPTVTPSAVRAGDVDGPSGTGRTGRK